MPVNMDLNPDYLILLMVLVAVVLLLPLLLLLSELHVPKRVVGLKKHPHS